MLKNKGLFFYRQVDFGANSGCVFPTPPGLKRDGSLSGEREQHTSLVSMWGSVRRPSSSYGQTSEVSKTSEVYAHSFRVRL
jgi:hypothetical protein